MKDAGMTTGDHPCKMRNFCDATYDAAERRLVALLYYQQRLHALAHKGPMEGCLECRFEDHRAGLSTRNAKTT